MAERDEKDLGQLSYKELQGLFPEGSDDPRVADLLRQKRTEATKFQPKGYYVGPDGRIHHLSEEEYNKLSDFEKREICVGDTCFHQRQDVDLGRKNS